MKVGILSDTHGVFREEWTARLLECDYLIHAGDISTKACYEKFGKLGIPVYMVRGNCDVGSWARYLPEFLSVKIGGKIFFIVHNRADLPFDLTEADVVVFGHTHLFEHTERFGKIFLNPGSAGQPRGDLRSMAVLELRGDSCDIRRILL